MRFYRILFTTALLVWSFSNGFSQETKIQNYICLNDQQAKNQMYSEGYELRIPDSWCGYIGFHDILTFSPKSLQNLRKNHEKNNFYIASYDNPTYKSINIEEALKKHYPLLNTNTQFAPEYSSEGHNIYGKYYILKYKSVLNGVPVLNLDILYNYKNQDYILYYTVLEKDFNTNLDEVIQIMESFKIVE